MGRLLDSVISGDERRIMEALAVDIAETIEGCRSPRDKAALSKRLLEVCKEIKALPGVDDANPVDEMAAFVAEFDEYEDPRLEGDGG